MVETKQITTKTEWDAFISKHEESNFLHSFQWGEFHVHVSHHIDRIGFYENNSLIGVMLAVVEPAKRGRYITVAGGPLIDWHNEEVVEKVVQTLKELGSKYKAVFIRIRPQLHNDEFAKETFKKMGFVPAPMHLHAQLTLQLDLTKSEDELLMNMRKNTRYEVRKAQSLGLTISKTTDPDSIRSFYELQLQTAKRHGFVPFTFPYLHEQFKEFSSNDMAYLYSAHHKKTLLAQAFIIFQGVEAVYHYGASTPEGRAYPGAYLLQWEAIKEAKKRGMKRYNFWGITHEHEKNHRFYGVSVFKRGFGGEEVGYLPAQDLIINKPHYLLTTAFEKLRKRIRKV